MHRTVRMRGYLSEIQFNSNIIQYRTPFGYKCAGVGWHMYNVSLIYEDTSFFCYVKTFDAGKLIGARSHCNTRNIALQLTCAPKIDVSVSVTLDGALMLAMIDNLTSKLINSKGF